MRARSMPDLGYSRLFYTHEGSFESSGVHTPADAVDFPLSQGIVAITGSIVPQDHTTLPATGLVATGVLYIVTNGGGNPILFDGVGGARAAWGVECWANNTDRLLNTMDVNLQFPTPLQLGDHIAVNSSDGTKYGVTGRAFINIVTDIPDLGAPTDYFWNVSVAVR